MGVFFFQKHEIYSVIFSQKSSNWFSELCLFICNISLIWRFPELGLPQKNHPFLCVFFPQKPTIFRVIPMIMEIPKYWAIGHLGFLHTQVDLSRCAMPLMGSVRGKPLIWFPSKTTEKNHLWPDLAQLAAAATSCVEHSAAGQMRRWKPGSSMN